MKCTFLVQNDAILLGAFIATLNDNGIEWNMDKRKSIPECKAFQLDFKSPIDSFGLAMKFCASLPYQLLWKNDIIRINKEIFVIETKKGAEFDVEIKDAENKFRSGVKEELSNY